jgi:hypothetical protein
LNTPIVSTSPVAGVTSQVTVPDHESPSIVMNTHPGDWGLGIGDWG